MTKAKRAKSKVKQLEEKFGGKWRYCGMGHWECDDGKRTVSAVSGHSMCDDENCDFPPRYFMYSDKTPVEVYLEPFRFGGTCLGLR